jgi:hypothetical protein
MRPPVLLLFSLFLLVCAIWIRINYGTFQLVKNPNVKKMKIKELDTDCVFYLQFCIDIGTVWDTVPSTCMLLWLFYF